MSRLSTAVAALAEANQVRHVLLAKLELKTRTLHLCTWTQDLAWGETTYVGNGDLAGVSAIEEGIDVSPYHVDLSLSGLNAQVMRDTLATEEFHLQEITLYVGFLRADTQRLQEDPVEVWSGLMDTAFLETTGATTAITLRCESHLAVSTGQRNPIRGPRPAESLSRRSLLRVSVPDAGPQPRVGRTTVPRV